MMKHKGFLTGIFGKAIVIALPAFALVLAGCGDNGGGSPGSPALEGTVSITGTAMVGQALTADTGSLLGTGAISYVWKRGDTAAAGTAISDAASATYTLAADDEGKYITVTVTRAGNSGSKTSAASAPVAAAGPALSGTVTVEGEALVGKTLTINETGLTNKTGTASYQWKRDAAAIANSNIASYTTTPDDFGKKITVTVTYSGNSGNATSNQTGSMDWQREVFQFFGRAVTIEDHTGQITPELTNKIKTAAASIEVVADNVDKALYNIVLSRGVTMFIQPTGAVPTFKTMTFPIEGLKSKDSTFLKGVIDASFINTMYGLTASVHQKPATILANATKIDPKEYANNKGCKGRKRCLTPV